MSDPHDDFEVHATNGVMAALYGQPTIITCAARLKKDYVGQYYLLVNFEKAELLTEHFAVEAGSDVMRVDLGFTLTLASQMAQSAFVKKLRDRYGDAEAIKLPTIEFQEKKEEDKDRHLLQLWLRDRYRTELSKIGQEAASDKLRTLIANLHGFKPIVKK